MKQKNKDINLSLTKDELIFLRDLFSICLPPKLEKTVSQSLSEIDDRSKLEEAFWKKITSSCEEYGIAIEKMAPDFVLTQTAVPELAVFPIKFEEK